MEQAPQDSNPRPSLTSRMAKFGQQTLSIRTANHAPRPRSKIHQSSSPLSQQDQPKYPIPIPSEKRKKAVKLYHAYRLAERLNRQEPPSATSNDGFHLSVPAPSTSHSIMSFASSKCSDFDGTTDISSVLSFGGDESPSSTKAKSQGDLISFSGDRVKTRVRKRLDPVKKAKAALIRHLGACKGCRDRKVPCSIEHHDLASLAREQAQPRQEVLNSSSSSTSRATPRSIIGSQQSFPGSQQSQTVPNISGVGSQADALFGIGGNLQLLQPESYLDNGTLDLLSPGGAHEEAQVDYSKPMEIYPQPSVPIVPENPYATYTDNMMFPIGVKRGYTFCCLYLGHCSASLHNEEELQTHFEQKHFCFTRIDPPQRFVCSSCLGHNQLQSDFCCKCFIEGSVQIWIYGNYIKPPSFHRQAPDRQNLFTLASPSIPFDTTSYTSSGIEFQWDLNMDDDDLNGGTRYTGFGTGGNGLGGTADDGFSMFPFNGADMNGDPSRGDYFTGHSSSAQGPLHGFQFAIIEAEPRPPRLQLISLLLLLAVAIFSYLGHFVVISKTEAAFREAIGEFHTHLPLVGLLVIAASFVTFFLFKLFSEKREQRTRALNVLSTFEVSALKRIWWLRFPGDGIWDTNQAIKWRQTVPGTFVLGEWWS